MYYIYKFQITNPKLQIISKSQITMIKTSVVAIYVLNLVFW